MRDQWNTHAHHAAKVVDVMHAAVHDGEIGTAVGLRVDDGGEVASALRGEEAAHLDCQVHLFGERLQVRRKFANRREGIAVILVSKIREEQARAIFNLAHFEVMLFAQLYDECIQHGQFLALILFDLRALGTGEIVNAFKVQMRILIAVIDGMEQITLIHAELGTGRQAQQHRINALALCSGLLQQTDVQCGFSGEIHHAGVHRMLNVGKRFVHAGEEDR